MSSVNSAQNDPKKPHLGERLREKMEEAKKKREAKKASGADALPVAQDPTPIAANTASGLTVQNASTVEVKQPPLPPIDVKIPERRIWDMCADANRQISLYSNEYTAIKRNLKPLLANYWFLDLYIKELKGINVDAINEEFLAKIKAKYNVPADMTLEYLKVIKLGFEGDGFYNPDIVRAFVNYAMLRNIGKQTGLAREALNEAKRRGIEELKTRRDEYGSIQAQYFYERGESYLIDENYGAARTEFNKALEVCRTSPNAYDRGIRIPMIYLNFGIILTSEHKWDEAIEAYNKVFSELTAERRREFAHDAIYVHQCATYGIGEAYYVKGFKVKNDRAERDGLLAKAERYLKDYLKTPVETENINRSKFMLANMISATAKKNLRRLQEAQSYIDGVNIPDLKIYDRSTGYLVKADIYARVTLLTVVSRKERNKILLGLVPLLNKAREEADNWHPKLEDDQETKRMILARADLWEAKIIDMTAGSDEKKLQRALVLIFKALGVPQDIISDYETHGVSDYQAAVDYIIKTHEAGGNLNFYDIELSEAFFPLVDLLARVELSKPYRADRNFTAALTFIDYLMQDKDLELEERVKLYVIRAKIYASDDAPESPNPEALAKAWKEIESALILINPSGRPEMPTGENLLEAVEDLVQRTNNYELLADLCYTAGDIKARTQMQPGIEEFDFTEAIAYFELCLSKNRVEVKGKIEVLDPVLDLRAKAWLTTIKFVTAEGRRGKLEEVLLEADTLIAEARSLRADNLITTDLEELSIRLNLQLTQADALIQLKRYDEAEEKVRQIERGLANYKGGDEQILKGRMLYYRGKIFLYRDKKMDFLLDHAEEILVARTVRYYYFKDLTYGYLLNRKYQRGIGLLSVVLDKKYEIPDKALKDPKLQVIFKFIKEHRAELSVDITQWKKFDLTFDLASFFFYRKEYDNSLAEVKIVVDGIEKIARTRQLKYKQKLLLAKAYLLKGQLVLWRDDKALEAKALYRKSLAIMDGLLSETDSVADGMGNRRKLKMHELKNRWKEWKAERKGELTSSPERTAPAEVQEVDEVALLPTQKVAATIPSDDDSTLKEARFMRGKIYFELGEVTRYGNLTTDYAESIDHYNMAITILDAIEEDADALDVKVYLARSYFGLGEIYRYAIKFKNDEKSIANYNTAIAVAQKYADPEERSYIAFLMIQARSYVGLGDVRKSIVPKELAATTASYDQAIVDYKKALEMVSNVPHAVLEDPDSEEVLDDLKDERADANTRAYTGMAEVYAYAWNKRNLGQSEEFYKKAFAAADEAESRKAYREMDDYARDSSRRTLPTSHAEVAYTQTSGTYTNPNPGEGEPKKSDQSLSGISANGLVRIGDHFSVGFGGSMMDLDIGTVEGRAPHYTNFDPFGNPIGDPDYYYPIKVMETRSLQTLNLNGGYAGYAWKPIGLFDRPGLRYFNGPYTYWANAGITSTKIDYTTYDGDNGNAQSLNGIMFDGRIHFELPPIERQGLGLTLRPYVDGYYAYLMSDHEDAFEVLNSPDKAHPANFQSGYIQPGVRLTSHLPFVGGYPTADLSLRYGIDQIGKTTNGLWPLGEDGKATDLLANITLSNEFHMPNNVGMLAGGRVKLSGSYSYGINSLGTPESQWSGETSLYNNRVWDKLDIVDPYLTLGVNGGDNTLYKGSGFYVKLGVNF